MFFAGVVSKMGAYGFIRFGITLFSGPVHQQLQPLLEALAVLSILYGALMALSENDIERIVPTPASPTSGSSRWASSASTRTASTGR